MKTTHRENVLLAQGQMREIEIAYPEGKKETVKAVVYQDIFGIVINDTDSTGSITHVPTGYCISPIFDNRSLAALGVVRVQNMLTSEDILMLWDIKDPDKARKNRLIKRIYKYLNKWARVCNNIETEKLVGVFYRDRADCEKLRWAINPKQEKTLLDLNALGSESMITKLIMENVKIAQ